MNRAPSLHTAAVMLAVFLCCFAAQEASACSQQICLEDKTCSGTWQDCPFGPNADCESYAFNAECTGTYTLHAFVTCESGCDGCEVCVIIEKVPGGTIVGSCSTECGADDCDQFCTVNLEKDQAYFMYVCRTPCSFETCEQCLTSCKSYGCLCYGLSSGPCVP
jgi:hypothetical protein